MMNISLINQIANVDSQRWIYKDKRETLEENQEYY